jgi:photosystem I subunit 3
MINSLTDPECTVTSCLCAQYDPESAPALALKATMERTEKRFANYANAGLLCGADGLPHLISDPGLALKYGHAGEVFVSAMCWGLARGGTSSSSWLMAAVGDTILS